MGGKMTYEPDRYEQLQQVVLELKSYVQSLEAEVEEYKSACKKKDAIIQDLKEDNYNLSQNVR